MTTLKKGGISFVKLLITTAVGLFAATSGADAKRAFDPYRDAKMPDSVVTLARALNAGTLPLKDYVTKIMALNAEHEKHNPTDHSNDYQGPNPALLLAAKIQAKRDGVPFPAYLEVEFKLLATEMLKDVGDKIAEAARPTAPRAEL